MMNDVRINFTFDELLSIQRQWVPLLIEGLPIEHAKVISNRIKHIRSAIMLYKPNSEVSNVRDYGNKAEGWYKTWEYILDVLLEELENQEEE